MIFAPSAAPPDLTSSSPLRDVVGGAVSSDSEIALSERLYRIYASSQATWAEQACENLEFYGGAHWTDEQKKALLNRGQKPVAIQLTYQVVEQAVAMFTANNPSFRATAREGSDVRQAHVRSDLCQWIWQNSNAHNVFKFVTRDYYVQGRGVMAVYIDPHADFGKGEVLLRDVEPKDIFPDPNSKHPLYDDASHVLVRRLMTAEQIKQIWPHIDILRLKESSNEYTYGSTGRYASHDQHLFPADIDSADHRLYEVIERYSKVKRPFHRLFNPQAGEEEVLSADEYRQRLLQEAYIVSSHGVDRIVLDPEEVSEYDLIVDAMGMVVHLAYVPPVITDAGEVLEQPPQLVPGEEGPSAVPGSVQRLTPTTVGALVAGGAIPVTSFLQDRVRVVACAGKQLCYEPQDLPTAHYPIIPFNNSHYRNPYPSSDVERIKDLNEVINKTSSLILAHAANSTNLKVFYPKGSIQDVATYENQWGKAGTAFIPVDPAYGERGGITIAGPVPLPAALYENMNRYYAMMERTLGIFSLQQGDPSSAPQTFKGTLQIDEYGLRRIKSKMDDIYSALARVGTVALDFASAVYTREKVLRLVQPNGQVKETAINKITQEDYTEEAKAFNDVTTGTYDVIVLAGSTLPSNRWAMLQTYMEMYQIGIVDDIAVLQRGEIPDADAILERKSLYSQMRQALEEASAQIDKLEGDMQTAERELRHGDRQVEREKFKARLAGYSAEIKKATQLFDETLQREQTHQKELMTIRNKKDTDGTNY